MEGSVQTAVALKCASASWSQKLGNLAQHKEGTPVQMCQEGWTTAIYYYQDVQKTL